MKFHRGVKYPAGEERAIAGVADSETWPHGGTAQSWEMPQWEVETPEAPHGGPGLQLGRPSGLCTAHSSAGPRLRRRAAGC